MFVSLQQHRRCWYNPTLLGEEQANIEEEKISSSKWVDGRKWWVKKVWRKVRVGRWLVKGTAVAGHVNRSRREVVTGMCSGGWRIQSGEKVRIVWLCLIWKSVDSMILIDMVAFRVCVSCNFSWFHFFVSRVSCISCLMDTWGSIHLFLVS